MPRDLSLDLARGFAVLCIPAIHTVMAFSQPAVYTSWLGVPLEWIAQGPGAQLFMLLMGMGAAFKPSQPWLTVMRRSLLLLAAGYALNTLKFVVPMSLGIMPVGVINALHLTAGWKGIIEALLIGDILHFAAIAWMFIAAVRRLPDYWFWALPMTVVIICASPLVWDKPGYVCALIGGQPTRVFFPFFPWIIYPLAGLTIGKCWQHDARLAAKRCGCVGAVLLVAGKAYAIIADEHTIAGFYRTLPGETVWHLGIVLLTLSFWKRISINVRGNAFFTLLQFCSRHITTLYLVQWVLICWLLPLVGYQSLNTLQTFFMCGYTTAITLCVGALLHKNEPLI